MYRDADKSLAQPGGKQATVTEDFDVHISYLYFIYPICVYTHTHTHQFRALANLAAVREYFDPVSLIRRLPMPSWKPFI
jgi:hypothetical protein